MRRQFSAYVLLLSLVVSTNASAIQIVDTRRLTSDPADQYNPVISGDWVVFTDTRNGNADI
jgi:beta propeller repeat protein